MNLGLLVTLLVLTGGHATAQLTRSDSLKQQLAAPLPDTSRVLLLDQLGRSLMYSEPGQAMRYAQDGLTLARTASFRRGEARILNRVGTIYRLMGSYDKALGAHLESVKVAESTRDTDALARTYNNIGVLYSEQKQSPKAIEFFRKTLLLAEQLGNADLKRIALSNLASDYARLNQLDSALLYTERAYDLTIQLGAADANVELVTLGNIYKRMGLTRLALSYYRQSILKSIEINDRRILGQAYVGMAEIFQTISRPDSAILFAKLGLGVARTANMPAIESQAATLLSALYEPTDPRQALAYIKTASAARDSLNSTEKTQNFQAIEFAEMLRQQDVKLAQAAFQAKVVMNWLLAGLLLFMAVAFLLYRNNRHKFRANRSLQEQRDEVTRQRMVAEKALADLKATQVQLIQKEKLASLGELTAGIAHEIQNPLNFVTNFAEVSADLLIELTEELQAGRMNDVQAITSDLSQNLAKIAQHGRRAEGIVKGMIGHTLVGATDRQQTDLNKLATDCLQLAYQQQQTKDIQFAATLQTNLDPNLRPVPIVAQDISRVLMNLFANAFYAVAQESKQAGKLPAYSPTVSVSSVWQQDQVEIRVHDNGIGMNEQVAAKVFQPFFTTKPAGEGTGMGLSICHSIVTRGAGGTLTVTSKVGEGTEFVLVLPIKTLA